MLDAEVTVCTDCGNLHMEGGAAPRNIGECAICGSEVADVEVDDLVSL